jgi:hypothetical protein
VVVAVPEGLPLAVTLTYGLFIFHASYLEFFRYITHGFFFLFCFSLAYSMRKMMRDKALVKPQIDLRSKTFI